MAHDHRVNAPLMLEQGPDLITVVVIVNNAMFITMLSFSAKVSVIYQLNGPDLLDTGPPS